jgi:uncharacterized protein
MSFEINDRIAAAAFRRLLDHMRHRSDVQNVDLMGAAGFCRNCLADWIVEAAGAEGWSVSREDARSAVYGISYDEWNDRHRQPATQEQLAKMEASIARNKS